MTITCVGNISFVKMLFQDESESAIIYYTDEGTIMIVITQSPWFLFVQATKSFVTLNSDEDKC